MTQLRRDTKAAGPRYPKGSQPVDPEELTRRLHLLLVEQKARTERRRASVAAKEEDKENKIYHHIPKVAAEAFERTATPVDTMRQTHKLSLLVVKQHRDPLVHELSGPYAPTLQKTLAADQARLDREMLGHRNQFQWTRDMEEADEADASRDLYKTEQRTFIAELAHLKLGNGPSDRHPLSTGDIPAQEDVPTRRPSKALPVHELKDRNDWTQQDEAEKRTSKGRISPFLRRRVSIWTLGKRERLLKQEKDNALAPLAESASSSEGRRSKRESFLSRFRRQPS